MFGTVTASSLVLGHSLSKGPNVFFTIWTSRISKDAEFHIDFKNIYFHGEKCIEKLSQNNWPFSRKSE
jgi:hypothetical protein